MKTEITIDELGFEYVRIINDDESFIYMLKSTYDEQQAHLTESLPPEA